MMPADDALWPRCNEHSSSEIVRHWCMWTRDYLIDGLDGNEIALGMPFSVPIAPYYEMYATCSLGQEVVPNFAYELVLVVKDTPILGGQQEEILGLWNKGEGRMIVATVLRDWAIGKAEAKCTAREHGFAEEFQLKKLQENASTIFEAANNWTMATEQCCMACWETRKAKADGSVVTEWNASSFGVQSSDFKRPVQNDRNDRTRSALQQRFGP